jgi:type IV pilus assembly protein PilE
MVKIGMQPAASRQALTRGFTLIEIMVVIAIVGILASIAWPNYQSYVRGARRAEAQSDILKLQLTLEKWRANNSSYASVADTADGIDTPADLAVTLSNANDYYNYSITGASGSAYTINAAAQGGQTADSSCTPLTLNQSSTKGPAGCWKS